ncbi:Endosomal protein P24B [Ceratocystis lukuohia]|uniref:Endosomal protein P24B n=1 Tax=Ceratocystis lukuohia TaxID=2019550 RepID=A0ABR4M9A3_9PEZI
MFFSTVAKLLLAATAFHTASAHNIALPAHDRECFHEELHKDDRMSVTFQVGDRQFGSAGNLDIDFWVTNPMGQYETYEKSVSNGDFSFDARFDGRYVYCFGNEHWGANSKEVSFNVHGIVYVSEADIEADPLETEGVFLLVVKFDGRTTHPIMLFKKSHANMASSSLFLVRHLSELLAQVKDEQSYIVVRERTHRNTAESTNARVKWWNLFVIVVVVGESLFQVWWLRRFFEVKRVV